MRKRSEVVREKTREEKAYLQGWRAGLRKESTKDGPANHRVESVRTAYLQGHAHGLDDVALVEAHAEQLWGQRRGS